MPLYVSNIKWGGSLLFLLDFLFPRCTDMMGTYLSVAASEGEGGTAAGNYQNVNTTQEPPQVKRYL